MYPFIKRRNFSKFALVALMLAALAAVAMPAWADEPITLTVNGETITFYPWTTSGLLPDQKGNWYLPEKDGEGNQLIWQPAKWDVPKGQTNLYLNGASITISDGGNGHISVGDDATLNLYDKPENENVILHQGNEAVVQINNGGTFNMYGGKIGAIYKDTSDDSAIDSAIGVSVMDGTFNMYGGSIEVEGDNAVGVAVANGTFTMSGGGIDGTTANSTGVTVGLNGTFTMSGGKINAVDGAHGVIMSGGAFKIKGAPEISGDTGVWLSDWGYGSSVIMIADNLTYTEPICVKMTKMDEPTSGVFTSGWGTYMTGKDETDYFTCNNDGYAVTLTEDGKEAQVVQVTPVTSIALDGPISVDVDSTVQLTATVQPDGATIQAVKWKSSKEEIATVDANGVVTGRSAGEVTITATAKDGSRKSAQHVVKVNKAASVVTKAPTAKTGLIYTGMAQELVTAGTASGGTMAYALNNGVYSTSIPAGTEAGSYTVSYKVAGDANHNDTQPQTLTVTIAPKPDDSDKTGDSGKSGGPGGELTEEQKAAQKAAEAELKQETEKKAVEAEKAAEAVDTSTEGGQALADLMSGNGDGSKTKEEQQATQAAALEVKQELEKSGLDVSDLSASEVKAAVENKEQEKKDAVYEAAGEVADTKVPAATDLLEKSSNEDLKDANEKLSVQPKVVEPEVAVESKDEIAATLGVPIETDIIIASVDKELSKQAEAVEALFNQISMDLASVDNSAGGKGVVIAMVFPRMRPHATGFFPLKVNLRHLTPGRRLKFWPSVSYFRQNASARVALVGVSLAAGAEGDFYFLDGDGNKVEKVTGDASMMTVVPFLTAEKEYPDAFITADASEKDQEQLQKLAENAGSGDTNAPTSDKGSGGCDAGFAGLALIALAGLVARKRK